MGGIMAIPLKRAFEPSLSFLFSVTKTRLPLESGQIWLDLVRSGY